MYIKVFMAFTFILFPVVLPGVFILFAKIMLFFIFFHSGTTKCLHLNTNIITENVAFYVLPENKIY